MFLILFLEFQLISAPFCANRVTTSQVEIDNYPVVFIVSISSLHEIVNTCKNLIQGIVAYTFLNVCERKFTSFCQVLKKMHTKEDWLLFSASQCIYK